jgi:hypothetical protein
MEAEIRLKGTLPEIAAAFARLKEGQTLDDAVSITAEEGTLPGLPRSIAAWFNEWEVPRGWRSSMGRTLLEGQRMEGVQLAITKGRQGTGKEKAARVRFVYDGQRQGFAFLGSRGRLFLALSDETDLSRFPHARWRQLGPTNNTPFNAYIYVRSEDTVDEALGLLREAYENSRAKSD